jgi:hypothetical protein
MKEHIFGNTDFGIRYQPNTKLIDHNRELAQLHLIIDNQIIGDPEEVCLVATWIASMEGNLHTIENHSEKLYHPEFENRTEQEIFELIYKSNQLEEEYKVEFEYLPVLPETIWQHCNFTIDETIDAYQIAMICKDEHITFIWKNLEEASFKTKNHQLHSKSIEKSQLIATIKNCLVHLKKDFKFI